LAQLANCLSLIDDEKRLLGAMEDFPKFYREALIEKLFARLGIAPSGHSDQDAAFVMKTFEFLEKSQAGWPQFFHDFSGGLSRENLAHNGLNQAAYIPPDFADWRLVFSQYEIASAPPQSDNAASLIYEQIGALWKPIDRHDDWSAFQAKQESFAAP
jgi:uncharacterized protein YdiU (UPF0061 family)